MERRRAGLRPRRLGIFDEESCRFFMQDIGQRLVPCYPFSVGIKEVYSLLFDIYGTSHVADAMSILHELLEDGQNANGVGDDGDAWRSWRFDWRHRNDDPLDPCAPTVGNYVLPPPTAKRVRLIKSANYVALNIERLSSAEKSVVKRPKNETNHESRDGHHAYSSMYANILCSNSRDLQHPNEISHELEAIELDDISMNKDGTIGGHLISKLASAGDENEEVPLPISKKQQPPHRTAAPGPLSETPSELALTGPLRDSKELDLGEDEDSEQEFDDFDHEDNTPEDNYSLTVSFVMLPSVKAASKEGRGGGLDIRTLRQIRTAASDGDASARLACRPLDQDSGSTQVNEQLGSLPPFSEYEPKTFEMDSLPDPSLGLCNVLEAKGIVYNEPSEDVTRVCGVGFWRFGETETNQRESSLFTRCRPNMPQVNEVPAPPRKTNEELSKEPSSYHSGCDTDRGTADNFCERGSGTSRATNRQARVVDGALISPQIQGSFHCMKSSRGNAATGTSSTHRSSMRLSSLGTPQYQHLRHSWVVRVRSLFHKDHQQNKQYSTTTQEPRKHISSVALQDARINMKGLFHPSTDDSQAIPMSPHKTTYAVSFDGGCDEKDVCRAKPIVNLDKELPPRPPQSSDKVTLSVRTNTPSLTFSQDTSERPSTGSTFSSGLSRRSSSRKAFRGVTSRLINPDMAGQLVDLSPLRETSETLDPTKFDPMKSPKPPRSPISFTSITNSNPYSDEQFEHAVPMPPPLSLRATPGPLKSMSNRGVPQSQSEPNLQPFSGHNKAKTAEYHIPSYLCEMPSKSVRENLDEEYRNSRGRPVQRPGSPMQDLRSVNENDELEFEKPVRKRSRSPVKRLLGLGKSSSLKDMAGEPDSQATVEHMVKDKKAALKLLGEKLRHGFLTSDATATVDQATNKVKSPPQNQRSTFPVSLEPPYQARIYSEMELMICVSANKFLMRQFRAGRMSADSVAKVKAFWDSKNRPQVIEFQYDQATQRDLILANLSTFEFDGESAENPMALNAIMYAWKTMSKEMAVRTFCTPDSVVRKHMHDTQKLLEMLGCKGITLTAFQETQVKALTKINNAQKERLKRQEEREEPLAVPLIQTSPLPKMRKSHTKEEKSTVEIPAQVKIGRKDTPRWYT